MNVSSSSRPPGFVRRLATRSSFAAVLRRRCAFSGGDDALRSHRLFSSMLHVRLHHVATSQRLRSINSGLSTRH